MTSLLFVELKIGTRYDNSRDYLRFGLGSGRGNLHMGSLVSSLVTASAPYNPHIDWISNNPPPIFSLTRETMSKFLRLGCRCMAHRRSIDPKMQIHSILLNVDPYGN